MAQPVIQARYIGDGIPVLIVHGWEMDHTYESLDFEPIFEKVPGYRRIYIDLPGMGKTPSHGIQSMDDIYKHLVDFMKPIDSKFLLMGTSAGAYLSRALAHEFPDRIDGLLLRVPVVEPESSKRKLDPFKAIVENDTVLTDELKGESLPIQTTEYIKAFRAKLDAAVYPSLALSNKATLKSIRKDPNRYRLSHKIIPHFQGPALVIAGRQDVQVGYRDAMTLVDELPRSTLAILDRASHALPVDERDLFESLVRDWLYRVKEWQENTRSKTDEISGNL